MLLLACRWLTSERERERSLVAHLINASTHHEVFTLLTSSKPNYLQRPHLQIPSCWGLWLQHMNWGVAGGNSAQSNSKAGRRGQGTERESLALEPTYLTIRLTLPSYKLRELVLFLYTNDCTFLQLNFHKFKLFLNNSFSTKCSVIQVKKIETVSTGRI